MTEETLEPGSAEARRIHKEAMQRHHDHFVDLEKTGNLSDEDKPNFTLAKQREEDGLVKPLVEESSSSPQPAE